MKFPGLKNHPDGESIVEEIVYKIGLLHLFYPLMANVVSEDVLEKRERLKKEILKEVRKKYLLAKEEIAMV